jgi:hypothetical protein
MFAFTADALLSGTENEQRNAICHAMMPALLGLLLRLCATALWWIVHAPYSVLSERQHANPSSASILFEVWQDAVSQQLWPCG